MTAATCAASGRSPTTRMPPLNRPPTASTPSAAARKSARQKSPHRITPSPRPNWQAQYQEEGADLSYQRPDYEIFDYPGRFKDEQHGADFAKYQMEGWRNNVDFASGTSNSPAASAGALVHPDRPSA